MVKIINNKKNLRASVPPCENKKAFTLLEILVSIVFLTVGFLAASRALSMGITAHRHAEHLITATMLAEDMMADAEVKTHKEIGLEQGDFEPDFSGYRWEKELIDVGSENVLRLSISVAWTERGKEQEMSLVTLLPRKSIAEGVH